MRFTWTITPGEHIFQFIADSDNNVVESDEQNNVVTQSITIFDSSQFVSQSVPVNMIAGQSYQVRIQMRNTGNTGWIKCLGYRLGSQNPQNNFTWGLSRVTLPVPAASGKVATFTFTIKAPTTPGLYNFQWRMLQGTKGWFGEYTPNIVVSVE